MWTCSVSTSAPSYACSTGMEVCRRSSSGRWLTWVGSRCGITTKPRPLWAGMALKNLFNASSPPAEAPIATTGKSLGWPSPASSASVDASTAGRGAAVPPSDSKRLADGFFPCLFAIPEIGSLSYPRGTITSELDVPPECILSMDPSLQGLCSVSKRRDVGYRPRFGPRTSGSRGDRCRSRIDFLLFSHGSAKGVRPGDRRDCFLAAWRRLVSTRNRLEEADGRVAMRRLGVAAA